MFKNILAPLDGSPMADRILPHVAAIAQSTGAPVTLLRILETSGAKSTAVEPMTWRFAKAEAQAHLSEASQQLMQLGLASNTVLLEGRTAQCIVEYAHTRGADLLVLSSHGQGGLSGWNVSGIAQKVIHRAGTSIMLVRSSDGSAEEHKRVKAEVIQYHHILAPLDGSQRAEHALPLANALAERHSAQLMVVHVATRPEMIERVPLNLEDAALAERIVARNTLEVGKYFVQLQSWLSRKTQTRVLINDSVTQALHDLVKQEQVDLVVLSAHGHSCNSHWPYSPLVHSFITYGATSLLILQDLPANKTRRVRVEGMTEDVAALTSSAYAENARYSRAHFEI